MKNYNDYDGNPWKEWYDAIKGEPVKQSKEERWDYDNLPKVKRPITWQEREIVLALCRCRFLPGSWDKRFVKSFVLFDSSTNTRGVIPEISDRQSYFLFKLAYKYRKQIGTDLSVPQENVMICLYCGKPITECHGEH